MGRDLLGQDYILKQLTASLMYPEKELGKEFWQKVYSEAQEKFGTTDISVDTFNKVWIVPDSASVYEKGNTVFLVESHLKVMLEEDYLSIPPPEWGRLGGGEVKESPSLNPSHKGRENISTDLIRQIILPAIEREVNEGQNFALLRQINNSLVLATWYKTVLKESLLGKIYADQSKVAGVEQADITNNQEIYNQYLEAFKQGVYNYTKEEYDPATQQIIPKKYFSGGYSTLQNGKPLAQRIHRVDPVQDVKVIRNAIDLASLVEKVTVNLDEASAAGESQDPAMLITPEQRAAEIKAIDIILKNIDKLKKTSYYEINLIWSEDDPDPKDAPDVYKRVSRLARQIVSRFREEYTLRDEYTGEPMEEGFVFPTIVQDKNSQALGIKVYDSEAFAGDVSRWLIGLKVNLINYTDAAMMMGDDERDFLQWAIRVSEGNPSREVMVSPHIAKYFEISFSRSEQIMSHSLGMRRIRRMPNGSAVFNTTPLSTFEGVVLDKDADVTTAMNSTINEGIIKDNQDQVMALFFDWLAASDKSKKTNFGQPRRISINIDYNEDGKISGGKLMWRSTFGSNNGNVSVVVGENEEYHLVFNPSTLPAKMSRRGEHTDLHRAFRDLNIIMAIDQFNAILNNRFLIESWKEDGIKVEIQWREDAGPEKKAVGKIKKFEPIQLGEPFHRYSNDSLIILETDEGDIPIKFTTITSMNDAAMVAKATVATTLGFELPPFSYNIHPADFGGKQGRNRLNEEQKQFVSEFIKEDILPQARAIGDQEMVRHLEQVSPEWVDQFVRHDDEFYLGSRGTASTDGTEIISLATDLIEAAQKQKDDARMIFKKTIIHELNHIIDFKNQRLPLSVFTEQNGDIIERSVIIRTAAYCDGFIIEADDDGLGFAAFYRFAPDKIQAYTTRGLKLAGPFTAKDYQSPPTVNKGENRYTYYEKIARINNGAKIGDSAMLPTVDHAELADPVGGIDLNPANIKWQIKRDGKGVALPIQFQDIPNINVEGFTPVIINIQPVSNLPLLLGAKINSEDKSSKRIQ